MNARSWILLLELRVAFVDVAIVVVMIFEEIGCGVENRQIPAHFTPSLFKP